MITKAERLRRIAHQIAKDRSDVAAECNFHWSDAEFLYQELATANLALRGARKAITPALEDNDQPTEEGHC